MYYGNKYGNKKVQLDGIQFDSRKEANRYAELKIAEKCGAIKDLQLQKTFELIPAQYRIINGKKKCVEQACKYKADFYYFDCMTNNFICEDTKGFKTKDYIIKRKLMLYVHDIRIVEI
jgi:hypothetical protein